MLTFYVYDADGDHMVDDCAELGPVEAGSLAEAEAEARRIWPTENLRVVAA